MLTIDSLSVSYGQSRILRDVSVRIQPGQAVCVLGRNGVGKTTLLKTAMGLLRPHSGIIRLDERDITAAPPHVRARAGIGYVPQGRGIFPHLSVYENLLMGLEAAPHLGLGALTDVYTYFPVLRQMAGRAAGVLSGGQQQQLALARALIRRPRLLLLDEPTEGIQPSIVAEIQSVIQHLQRRGDVAILLVEQFLDFALSLSSTYYIMEKGQIVAHGASQQISHETVQRYLSV